MHKLLMLSHMFLTIISTVQSQAATGPDGSFNQPGSFQANLAVVISVLACMFFLTFFILVYAKFCRRTPPNGGLNPGSALTRSTSRFSGIDKTVIESLPYFRFSSLRGSREGLECAVCLSKFQDVEILRLLPKCKHAFHIGCVDQWLEKHSSCPLCRLRVSPEDVALVTYTNSLRFLGSHSDLRQDSNLDLFVQREGDGLQGLEDVPIQENGSESLHKYHHKIMFSEFVMNNRWSSLNSSDLMSIHSEMISITSGYRFGNEHNINARKQGINEDVGKQISHDQLGQVFWYPKTATTSKILDPNEKRSMSEIVVHPRFTELSVGDSSSRDSSFRENKVEEKMRRLWMPIARRTVQWFANRDRRSPQSQNVRQSFDL